MGEPVHAHEPGAGTRKRWLVRLLVLGVALLPSLGTLGAPWISDDAVILGRVHAHGGLADWLQPQYDLVTVRFWRPLVSVSWSLQESLFGVDPLPFRVLNLACHALAALLLAEVALALGTGLAGALLAGALVGLFPEQGGTVTWVAGRVDSLTLPFFAGALLCVVRGRPGLALASAFCACACKETSFALPALVAVLALAPVSPGTGRRIAAAVLATLAVAVAFVWRRLALGDWLGGYPTTAVGPLEGAGNVALALWDAAGPTLGGLAVILVLGLLLRTLAPRVVIGGLLCAGLAAAPLFALLLDGELEETNRRTLAFFDLGLALAAGGAVARWREARFGAPVLVLAALLCGWRGSLAWRDTHEWAAAGRVAENAMQRARGEAERSGAGRLPLLATLLPQLHGGAYALAWGVAERTRAPFPETPRPVWPARPVFFRGEADARPHGARYARFGNSYVASEASADEAIRIAADGFGELLPLVVDERVLQAEPDRSDAFVFAPAPGVGEGGVELVLHTELGYQAFPWDAARTRVSLMQAFGTSNGTVTMGDVFLLAASTGARAAYLEVREAGGGTEAAASPWVELSWDPAVLDLVR